MTEETKRKISIAKKGNSPVTSGSFKKGLIPWNKGTVGVMKAWNKGKKGVQVSKFKGTKGFFKPNKTSFKKGMIPWIKGKKHSPESIEKSRRALLGRPSWNKGKHQFQTVGEKNPRWKGGITPENRRVRTTLEMKLWKKACLERDDYTCRKTSIRGGRLVVHHIHNFADFPELRTSIENGITLSVEAHREFHRRYGNKRNTKEQMDEFLKDASYGHSI